MAEGPEPSIRKDWLRLGGVVALGAVLSLIGFNVASTLEPSGNPSAEAVAAEATTTTDAPVPSTTGAGADTTPPSTGPTTTVQPSEPATLALSNTEVDLGAGNSTALEIVHTSGGSANWSLNSDHPGVIVDPAEGRLGPGESASIEVGLNREEVGEGEHVSTLTLGWDSGETSAQVVALVADNPIIHNPRVTPSSVEVAGGGSCSPTQTTISARVRDTSEVDRVIARWSPDGTSTRETVMQPVGEDIYEGVIGPFDVARTDSVKVVAYDVLENAGGASISVPIEGCPADS